MPSTPRLPLLDFTRFKACKQFSRSQTSSISCSLLLAGLSIMHFAGSVSDPPPGAIGASLRPSPLKASQSWLFCRLSPIESRRLLAASFRLGLRRMPHIRFLSIGSRLCSTLLSDPASRRCPCASLSLLLHQDVKGTYTPKLLNMLGTQSKTADQSARRLQIFNADAQS